MIFVTVGTQLGFDRLIHIIDRWNSTNSTEIFCQIGESNSTFDYLECEKFITPLEYKEVVSKCEIIVAHAGIGSILSAMEYNKPIILFPRKASMGEHRNEHQLATINQFENKRGIYVARDNNELINLLDNRDQLFPCESVINESNNTLIQSIKNFINE